MPTRRAFLAGCAALPCLGAAPIGAPEHARRRRALADRIGRGVIVLAGADESDGQSGFTGFRQESNFHYLSGLDEPGAALLIAAAGAGGPYREILFLAGSGGTGRQWHRPALKPEDAGHLGFDDVQPESQLRQAVRALQRERGSLAGLAHERAGETLQDRSRRERLAAALGSAPTRDVSAALAALRSVKSPAEVALMRAAAEATEAAFREAWSRVTAGARERDVAAGLVAGAFRAGCQRLAFTPIVAAGPSATILHYRRKSGRLKRGQVLLIDAGGERSRYAADIARSVPVGGRFSARQKQLYQAVLAAQDRAIAAVRPGVTLAGPARESVESVAQRALRQGAPRGVDAHLPHAIGHHVGLDVHDPAPRNGPLKPGMVLAIEPGLYLPDEGIGIRIEDMVEVTADGCRMLSAGLPREAGAVEAGLAAALRRGPGA